MAQRLRGGSPPSSNRGEARRLADEIRQMIVDADIHLLDRHLWGEHDFKHLRDMVAGNEVDGLAAAKRVLLPLRREFSPMVIGAMVKNMKRMGVGKAGDLVTRKSVTHWMDMVDAINEYGRSVGNVDIVIDDMAQEIFMLVFTDPDITTAEVMGVVNERGLVPAESMRALIMERREASPALVDGVL